MSVTNLKPDAGGMHQHNAIHSNKTQFQLSMPQAHPYTKAEIMRLPKWHWSHRERERASNVTPNPSVHPAENGHSPGLPKTSALLI